MSLLKLRCKIDNSFLTQTTYRKSRYNVHLDTAQTKS